MVIMDFSIQPTEVGNLIFKTRLNPKQSKERVRNNLRLLFKNLKSVIGLS